MGGPPQKILKLSKKEKEVQDLQLQLAACLKLLSDEGSMWESNAKKMRLKALTILIVTS